MRAVLRFFLAGLGFGLAVCLAGADNSPDRTGELDAAARSFVKAYHAKDVDALLNAADAPFFVGTLRRPKTLTTAADLRAELKARLARGDKFPAHVEKTLTWQKAITGLGVEEERRTRQAMKPAIDTTGADGGYAALADPVGGGKGRRQWMAISELRLLVGIRDGKAKVVGILADETGKR
ncbi:MAG TPA: hypothetical protein VGF55_15020 [Gemmataceae bacterium]|jgi:hypothetical protein